MKDGGPSAAQQELQAAATTAAAKGETQVLLLTGTGPDAFRLFRLNPTARLAQQFRGSATSFASELLDREVVTYSYGRKLDDWEVARLPVNDVPQLPPILAAAVSLHDLELFEPDRPDARLLRLYLVIARDEKRTVQFLRAMSPNARLTRRGKIAAFMTGPVYDSLDSDALLFDKTFDAMISGGRVFVVHQRNFQRTLWFVEEARAAAVETLRNLTMKIPIANLDEFLARTTSDLRMVAKVRSIAEKLANPGYAEALTMPRLVKFVRAHPDLGIELEGAEGHEQLVFHSDPQRRWRILKLLDDDYLRSQVTEIEYEANSKQPIK